jgi:amino acid transporter
MSGGAASGAAPAATTEQAPAGEPTRTLTLRGATVLGIGSMIGAGIFALLGEAGAVAGSAVWISFLVGGIVAGLLGYVCAGLGVRYPSSGGLVTYLVEGFGAGRLVGVAAWLGYISAVVIVTAMVVVSFGGYATSLFVGEHAGSAWNHLFITLLLLVMLAINMVGAKVVAAAQSLIVLGVLAVFAVFICVTVPTLDPSLLDPADYPSASKIISAVALTFFAYLGFNVITFTGGDLRNPRRDIPRATYLAIGITAVVYVLITLGVFGTLTVAEVVQYGETAIAEAARPTLGDAGFTIMAIVALLSTAGATNATLYASSNLTGMLAEQGFFPQLFGARSRLGPKGGLIVTTGLVLLVANLVDLGAIASVGSAVSLLVFVLVGVAGWRRRADTGSNTVLILLAIAATAGVLVFFAVDTARNDPQTFGAIVGIAVLSIALDAVFRRPRSPDAEAGEALAARG